MNKKEALIYCQEKRKQGWLTHVMILEIYEDEDEVSEDVMNLICQKRQPPKPIIIHVGIKGLDQIDRMFKEEYENNNSK